MTALLQILEEYENEQIDRVLAKAILFDYDDFLDNKQFYKKLRKENINQ